MPRIISVLLDWNSSHPFFAGMFETTPNNSSSLQGIASPKIFESYSLAANAGLPLIKLSNGSPFLLEARVGKGDILLYNIPPTMAYSDFPQKSIFLPLIRRTAAYASSIQAVQDERQSKELVTTEPIRCPIAGIDRRASRRNRSSRASTGWHQFPRAPSQSMPMASRNCVSTMRRIAGNYTVFRDAAAQVPVGAFAVNIQSE